MLTVDEDEAIKITINNKKLVEQRIDAITSMYQYDAVELDHAVVPENMEIINNWYIVGIRTIERLLELVDEKDIPKIYDNKYIDQKVFIKDK